MLPTIISFFTALKHQSENMTKSQPEQQWLPRVFSKAHCMVVVAHAMLLFLFIFYDALNKSWQVRLTKHVQVLNLFLLREKNLYKLRQLHFQFCSFTSQVIVKKETLFAFFALLDKYWQKLHAISVLVTAIHRYTSSDCLAFNIHFAPTVHLKAVTHYRCSGGDRSGDQVNDHSM